MRLRFWRLLGPTMVLLLAATACGGEGDEAEDEVRAASAAWDGAHNSGDVTGLTALYAEDAVSMPYYGPAIEGRAAIQGDFQAFFADFDAIHETTIVGLQIAGDWAIERGEYTLEATAKDGSESFEEAGKHIVVRQRTDDGWKVVWEIWNLDEAME